MTRKEAYSFIKENNLGSMVEQVLHCNYTRCKTKSLEKFINQYNESTKGNKKDSSSKNLENTKSRKTENSKPRDNESTKNREPKNSKNPNSDALTEGFLKLVSNLCKKHILLPSEMNDIIEKL